MTPLAAFLRQHILDHGPLPFADFMAHCLNHPQHGYYAAGERIGKAGDFTTAPEISQIFGELIGLWMVDCWSKLGEPRRLRLIELGPGRGLLMQDALRAAALRPAFIEAVDLHLVETNADLAAAQRRRIGDKTAHWHGDIDSLPADGPLIMIANEFFDALPVRILRATEHGWRERYVDWNPGDEEFFPAEGPPSPPVNMQPAETGAVREMRPAADGILNAVLDRTETGGGYGLIIDYGYTAPPGHDTVEAVRRHRHVDALTMPGETDLTAHVDFTHLTGIAEMRRAAVHGPVPQAQFLINLGLTNRTQALLAVADEQQKESIQSAVRRLIAPSQMGAAFLAMAFSAPGLPAPEGFGA